MKYTRSFLSAVVTCAIAVAIASNATAQSRDGAAKVIRIKGSARSSAGNNVWRPLKVGDVLRPGTIVQTDRESGSYVDLVLADTETPVVSPRLAGAGAVIPAAGGYGVMSPASLQPLAQQNTVRVYENTVLGIDRLTAMQTGADVVTDTQLDLRQGHILGNVKKMSAASRYEIKLPNGVAGIRGTVYDIYADGRVRVASGTVVLSIVDANGNVQTRVITAGNEYNPRTDQIVPLAPQVLEEIESAATAFRTSGTVFVNTLNANPGMILVPLTPNLVIREQVSPTGGIDSGGGDGEETPTSK